MSLSVAGVVLAGGLSRRMGGVNKAGQMLGGQTLLTHAIHKLKSQTKLIAINANHKDITSDDYPIIKDSLEGFLGPLAGVLAGLEWASTQNATHIMTVATDTPFYPNDLLAKFLRANKDQKDQIILAGSGGYRHPVFGLWPVTIAADLRQWLLETDTNKVLAFIQRHHWAIADFDLLTWGDETLDPFFNINTADDLMRAELLLKAHHS